MLEAIVAAVALSAPMQSPPPEPPPPRMQQRERGPGMGEARPDRGGRPGPGGPPRGGMPQGEGMGPDWEMWREFAEQWERIDPERRERIREEMRREFEGMRERFRREMGERLRHEAGGQMEREMQTRRERAQRPGAMGDGPAMRDRLREAMQRNPDAVREALRHRLAERARQGGMPLRGPRADAGRAPMMIGPAMRDRGGMPPMRGMQRGMMGGRGMGMPPAMRGGPAGPRPHGMAMGRGGVRGGEGCCCGTSAKGAASKGGSSKGKRSQRPRRGSR